MVKDALKSQTFSPNAHNQSIDVCQLACDNSPECAFVFYFVLRIQFGQSISHSHSTHYSTAGKVQQQQQHLKHTLNQQEIFSYVLNEFYNSQNKIRRNLKKKKLSRITHQRTNRKLVIIKTHTNAMQNSVLLNMYGQKPAKKTMKIEWTWLFFPFKSILKLFGLISISCAFLSIPNEFFMHIIVFCLHPKRSQNKLNPELHSIRILI